MMQMAPARRSAGLSKRSLYQLNATWTTQDGTRIKFASLRGKIRLIAMIYASCQYACPLTISDLKRIEQGIPKAQRAKVGFVLVTIDPKRDTPAKLKELAQKRKLDLKRWTLLRGSPDDILELAALLGVKYKKVSDTMFAHSNLITVLDAQGVMKHQQVGLNQSPKKTLQVLYQLLGLKKKSP